MSHLIKSIKANQARRCSDDGKLLMFTLMAFTAINNEERGAIRAEIAKMLTINTEVHAVEKVTLLDQRIGGLANERLSNVLHLGSKAQDAHRGVAIAGSLEEIGINLKKKSIFF